MCDLDCVSFCLRVLTVLTLFFSSLLFSLPLPTCFLHSTTTVPSNTSIVLYPTPLVLHSTVEMDHPTFLTLSPTPPTPRHLLPVWATLPPEDAHEIVRNQELRYNPTLDVTTVSSMIRRVSTDLSNQFASKGFNYGFVEFDDPGAAERAMQTLNGRRIHQSVSLQLLCFSRASTSLRPLDLLASRVGDPAR
jgi:hypothetical protein